MTKRGIVGVCALAVLAAGCAAAARAPSATQAKAPAVDAAAENFGKLPLSFEANVGQTDPRVRFLARGPGFGLFLTESEAVLSLERPDNSGAVVRLTPVEAARAEVVGLSPQPGKANYLVGDRSRWHTGVPTFGRVAVQGLWPGVEVIYHGDNSKLEYDFVVAPGTDPAAIRLAVGGADSLRVDAAGALVAETPAGPLVQPRPVAWQEKDGRRLPVDADYVLEGTQVGFRTGPLDRSLPLVIDPVFVYATYLGGGGADDADAIAVDGSGNAYVTGTTTSLDFPFTAGADDTTRGGTQDAYVAKLNPSGSALVYATYLGGGQIENGHGIAVDNSGNAYVTGTTNSPDFPLTATPADNTLAGVFESYVAKVNPAGSDLVYATYLGGNAADDARSIAVDGSGNAYVAGSTLSPDFPVTGGADDTTLGGQDTFVVKVNTTGTAFVYATFVGGADTETGSAIAVDGSGNAYVTGLTTSDDFPATPGAYATTGSPFGSAYVAKVNSTGSDLVYATFIGGSEGESGSGIAVDSSGNAYIVGSTGSLDFPVTPGAHDVTTNTNGDAFVAKFNTAGSALVYSTFVGGTDFELGLAIAVDSGRNAYITGRTESTDFPVFGGDASFGAPRDSYVAKLNPAGSALAYATYIGGTGIDLGLGIAVDGAGNAYATGETQAADFPDTPGALDGTLNGGTDAYIVKLGPGFICETTYTNATILDVVTVPTGAVCTLDASTTKGNVVVRPGGTLFVENGSVVGGSLTAQGATVNVINSSVRGNVVLTGSTDIGGEVAVGLCGSTFGGSVTVRNSVAPARINIGSCGPNIIRGTLSDLNNVTTGFHFVHNNTVGGNLVCSGNAPPPNVQSNTVTGATVGQCIVV